MTPHRSATFAFEPRIAVREDGAGDRVLVLPPVCGAALHPLASVGYQARIVGGEIRVGCKACGPGIAEYALQLPDGGLAPRRAELVGGTGPVGHRGRSR